MTHRKPSLAARIRAEATRSYLGPANLAEEAEANPRISSLMPHGVSFVALIGAISAFGFTAKQWLLSGRMPWALLVFGIVHAIVALASFVRWKRVWREADYYHVSDLFRSETISLVDVCMVVEERGLIWNTLHIHFKRLTRFRWSASYVPARPIRLLDWLTGVMRSGKSPKPELIRKS